MIGKDFYFNGENSVDKGVSIVKLSTGFDKMPFLAEKQIREEKVKGRDKPYFFGVERKPLQLKLVLSCVDEQWTLEKRRELARWLNTNDYAEFYVENEITKIYYVQYISGIDLSIQTTMHGYIEVFFRCDSPYAYTKFFLSDKYQCNTSPTVIEFTNHGDADLYPEMWITKKGSSDVGEELSISSHYDDIDDVIFTNLVDEEIIYVDNENQDIKTSRTDVYRFNDHNGGFLCLRRGVNTLTISGGCELQFRYRYKIWG